MDLRAIVNDEKSAAQGKGDGRNTSATAPAPPYSNAQPSTPSQYGHSSQQNTPLYAPPSASGIVSRPSQAQGVTPLRTPSQTVASAQYPFPSQTQQSPISAVPGQSYRPFEGQPSAGAARPGSHGHSYQTSQPASYTSQTPIQQQHSYTSISPTPPSNLSRTPSSMRQSPLATITQLPSHQQTHYSQPNTPLGPPQHYPQRAPTFPDTHSPYHQRRVSNASNGLISGSPAQQHPGIPNLVESPSAYARPSPRTASSRQPSEYLSHSQRASRERSISVSPKTKPPPRPPSLGSRQSSNSQEAYGARVSEQYNNAPLAGAAHHVTSQQQPSSILHSQSGFPSQPNAATGVSQATPHSLQPAPNVFPGDAQSSLSSQSGNYAPQPQPLNTISHQNEKMGMSHLVTPASEVPPQINGHSTLHTPSHARSGQDGGSIPFKTERSVTPQKRLSHETSQSTLQRDNNMVIDQRMVDVRPNGAVPPASNDMEARASLKRPASSSTAPDEPPSKHIKSEATRQPRERPLWARLSRFNPRFHEQGQQGPMNRAANGPQARLPRENGNRASNGAHAASHPPASNGSGPLDTDLMRVRSFLGDWERSFANTLPLADTKRAVADWIFTQLAQLRDVGTDPQYGTVEIEGKIGTLFHKDTGERISLPVMNTVILNAAMSEQYRFESRMQEFEHSHMNKRLNAATQNSMKEPHRVRMDYKHFVDVDSFRQLSASGIAALPPSIRSRVEGSGKHPKLRTTVRHEKERAPYVAARIVKVNVANLQIYSPNDPYDLRISVNVEVNLDRPGLNPDDFVVPTATEKEPTPDRKKDRVSYTHLAYQIDLTRVDVGCGTLSAKSAKPIYELELEVDSLVLRRQMEIAAQGEPCAFGDVVAGFWDNAVLLMRERAPAMR